MKYNRLIVIVFFVFNCLANAQIDNLDTKAKYLLNTNKLITEENGRLYVDFYSLKTDPEEDKMKIAITRSGNYGTIEELLAYYKKSREDLIKLSDLSEKKSSIIIDDLKKKQFSFSGNNKKFNVIDKENVIIRSYIKGEQSDMIFAGAYLFNLHTIIINKKYTVFIVENNKLRYSYGYILPLKNKYRLEFEQYPFELEIRSKTDSSDVYNAIGLYYKKGNFFKKNNKYGLKSESGNQILMQPVYDTLYYYENFILGKKEKLFQLHSKNGELLHIPNIRGIIQNKEGYGALIKNKTYWMDSSGSVFDSLPRRNPQPVCGTVPHIVLSIVKEKDNFKFYYSSGDYGYQDHNEDKILCSSDNLKNISFLNQQTKIDTDGNNYPYVESVMATNNYIVETLNNDKSIAEIKDGKIAYLLNPAKYTFTYINQKILKFELKGLYGLFPFQKKPKYTMLSNFEKGFARFELPNGKKGWLDLDGHEYPDI